jgi:hypothetical protein
MTMNWAQAQKTEPPSLEPENPGKLDESLRLQPKEVAKNLLAQTQYRKILTHPLCTQMPDRLCPK